jgi:hypothetical protein
MRKSLKMAAAVLTAAVGVAVVPAGPAQADPCGASSYVSGNTQYVGYRNCGGSIAWRRGHIGGTQGACYGIEGYSSGILHKKNTGGVKQSWNVTTCR